jgi:hypothetical protein
MTYTTYAAALRSAQARGLSCKTLKPISPDGTVQVRCTTGHAPVQTVYIMDSKVYQIPGRKVTFVRPLALAGEGLVTRRELHSFLSDLESVRA